ncbi:MAG: hypothetical protein IT186_12720 [Acidobacteria bacterium]|nr:hypothetical protein [Acidobacteriota bacterium]
MTMRPVDELTKEIQAAIGSSGLSGRAIASKAGVSERTVRRLLGAGTGPGPVSLAAASAVLDALGWKLEARRETGRGVIP